MSDNERKVGDVAYLKVQVDRANIEHFGRKRLVHVVPVGSTMYVTPEHLVDDPTQLLNRLADSLETALHCVEMEQGEGEGVLVDRALIARVRKEWPRPPTPEEREEEMLAREQLAEDMTPERPGGCD
ncbi:MAG: hypothetical protein KGJ23_08725 [Euryarchaeota archaeon]|nr:hypothetical protein [Euryarchaeota archaeon]MDE1836687.1 hypothetical protein [Euryarchaeota archaeon]MDE1880284.1 hypothetical protein [Euryarchaeota archaeon]MDE2044657.1 hypothetical protein [Thermoplasmata archaeon]